MPEIKVNLIGAGRVGQTLLRLLYDLPECTVQNILSTRHASSEAAAQFVGAGRAIEAYADLQPADLWLFTVPDTQIATAAANVAHVFKARKGQELAPIAFHCSGFFAAEEMAPLRKLGWQLASVHPVLTFSDPKTAVRQFPGTFCGIEGDAPALERLKPLLIKMGAQPFPVKSESKSLYHAAAVISNNFTVVLQAIAREAWREAGVPDDVILELNKSLLQATEENVSTLGPQKALTGPAARGDVHVVKQQGEDVAQWHPTAGVLYKDLSRLARALKLKGLTQ